ncbi:hypothetical protein AB0J21_26375 [Streptomyces sp. NPDC049954]|uniref:hypothetical protein n=1 Tax=Streptomyces sp. NPDC049954 TaxID=3155779 RepID=UPI003447FEEC
MGVAEASPSLPPSRAPRSGRSRLLRAGSGLAVLCALGGYAVVQYTTGDHSAHGCRVVSANGDGETYEFDAGQAVNAATISAVGTSRGLPERAVTIALATALQESGLRNIGYGDRDSLGLFQQRPSQGWGTRTQVMDPVYAANRFYERLVKVPHYTSLPLTEAAQRVQRSAFPEAYAKHEPDASLLSAALTGRAAAALTCAGTVPPGPGDPARVRAALVRDFGRAVLPGGSGKDAKKSPAPTPSGSSAGAEVDVPARAAASAVAAPLAPLAAERVVRAGRAAVRGSGAPAPAGTPAASDSGAGGAVSASAPGSGGRTVHVPVAEPRTARAASEERHGWELAQWAVAHASVLRISEVSYAGRSWTSRDAGHNWHRTARETRGASAGRDADGDAKNADGAPGEAARETADVRIVTSP